MSWLQKSHKSWLSLTRHYEGVCCCKSDRIRTKRITIKISSYKIKLARNKEKPYLYERRWPFCDRSVWRIRRRTWRRVSRPAPWSAWSTAPRRPRSEMFWFTLKLIIYAKLTIAHRIVKIRVEDNNFVETYRILKFLQSHKNGKKTLEWMISSKNYSETYDKFILEKY